MRARSWTRVFVAFACALGAVACGNPAQDNLINSLGPEASGVRRGPLHRPGQPCLACHSAAGGRHPQFSVAGTVYQTSDSTKPARDVIVELTDSKGRKYSVASNCAGNFYVQERDFQPVYPMTVKLEYGSLETKMFTNIYREGSCAGCHYDPPGYNRAEHVYVDVAGQTQFPGGCQ